MAIDIPPKIWMPPKPAIVRRHALDWTNLTKPVRIKPHPMLSTFPMPFFMPSASEPPVITYIGHNVQDDSTTLNFGSFDVGSGNPVVLVGIVALHNSGNRTVSSVSIGGTDGTIHVSEGASARPCLAMASRVVAGGGSINISVTYSATINRGSGCGVWAITNYTSSTPYDAQSDNNVVAGTGMTITVDHPANSVGAACYYSRGSSATWAGGTERYDDSSLQSGFSTGADHTETTGDATYDYTTTTASKDLRAIGACVFM